MTKCIECKHWIKLTGIEVGDYLIGECYQRWMKVTTTGEYKDCKHFKKGIPKELDYAYRR